MDKRESRLRRSKRTRAKIRELGVHRLCVHRTPRHIYAQIISPCGRETLMTVSTIQPTVREMLGASSKGNCAEAEKVGTLIAQQCLEKGIKTVAFDRSGNRYHGRVRALAEKAREAGLEF